MHNQVFCYPVGFCCHNCCKCSWRHPILLCRFEGSCQVFLSLCLCGCGQVYKKLCVLTSLKSKFRYVKCIICPLTGACMSKSKLRKEHLFYLTSKHTCVTQDLRYYFLASSRFNFMRYMVLLVISIITASKFFHFLGQFIQKLSNLRFQTSCLTGSWPQHFKTIIETWKTI